MKLILKPFKFLFKLIVVLLILLIIFIALLYKSVTPPTISNDTNSLKEIITEEIDHLIDETNTNKIITLGLDINMINKEIRDTLLKSTQNSDEDYIMTSDYLNIQGLWLEYNKDSIDIVLGIHLKQFKTRVLINVIPKYNSNNTITLEISKIKLGNISIKWLIKMSSKLNDSIKNTVENELGINGLKYDPKKLTFTANIDDILNNNESNEMLNALILLLKENNMVSFGMNNDSNMLELALDLNDLEDNSLGLSYPVNNINSKEELDSFLQAKGFESLVSTPGKLYFNEEELNNIFNYFITENLEFDYLTKETLYEDYELIVGIPYITITNNKAIINIEVLLGKDNNYFKTKIKIDYLMNKSNNDLILSLIDLNIAELIINDTIKDSLIKQITNESSEFVIKDFFKSLSDNNIDFNDEIKLENNEYLFTYDVNGTLDIFNSIINSDLITNNIKDIVGSIENTISKNEDTEELVDNLLTEFEKLTEEEKEDILLFINSMFK